MSLCEMYAQRAADCRREATATPLTQVRDRCLRAAEAFPEMADRAERAEVYRANEAERKAEQLKMPEPFFSAPRYEDF